MRLLIMTMILALLPVSVSARPGDLDTSFGTEGVGFFNSSYPTSDFRELISFSNGHILAAGSFNTIGSSSGMLLEDGMFNYGYGFSCSSGLYVCDTFGFFSGFQGISLLDTLSLEKYSKQTPAINPLYTGIYEAAQIEDSSSFVAVNTIAYVHDDNVSYDTSMVITKQDSRGNLDTTFGLEGNKTGAVLVDNLGTHYNTGYALNVQSDGKILTAGSLRNDAFCTNIKLVRLNADGTYDKTFGPDNNGIVQSRLDSYVDFPECGWYQTRSMALQDDGKIIVSGHYGLWQNLPGFFTARYHVNGLIDTNFGNDGSVIHNIALARAKYSYLDFLLLETFIQSDGKIVLFTLSENALYVLIRLNKDGSFDSSYGVNGIVEKDISGSHPVGAALQKDNKMVVLGTKVNDVSNNEVVLARFLVDGTLDDDFGVNGVATSNLGLSSVTDVSAMTLDTDNNILITGKGENIEVGDERMLIAKFLNVVPPPAPPIPDLDASSDNGSSDSDDLTSDTTPTFTGTAEVNATVKLYNDSGVLLGTGIATDGNWRITTSALTAGTHLISATATDSSANVSLASEALSVTIDNSAPADYNVTFNQDTFSTAEGTISLSGAEIGSTYTYSISSSGGGTITGSGLVSTNDQNISFTNLTDLTNGLLTISFTLTDDSGNVGLELTHTATLNVTIINDIPAITEGTTTTDGTTSSEYSFVGADDIKRFFWFETNVVDVLTSLRENGSTFIQTPPLRSDNNTTSEVSVVVSEAGFISVSMNVTKANASQTIHPFMPLQAGPSNDPLRVKVLEQEDGSVNVEIITRIPDNGIRGEK
ncbi:MAG: Ig-like domain-containing protein [Campylobacterota bacterium]